MVDPEKRSCRIGIDSCTSSHLLFLTTLLPFADITKNSTNMRFTFPTTTIASVSGAAYLASSATTIAAANVGLAYQSGSIRAASKMRSTECSFANGFAVQRASDTGILECGMVETCVEDKTSSAGGRCVALEDEALVDSQRKLTTACTFKNGTAGVKCTNCDGTVDLNKVGCGSCIGKFDLSLFRPPLLFVLTCLNIGKNGKDACVSWSGDITVGEGSCVGPYACANMTATTSIVIGDGSCHDNVACSYIKGECWEVLLERGL